MRTTLATVVIGLPYIVALIIFAMFRESGDPVADKASTLTWGLYLGALAAGYALSSIILIDRDHKRSNILNDFISSFWPYVTVMGLVQVEPRFRQAFDLLWASRTEDFLMFRVLGLIYVPCFIAFAAVQMMMDPELGHVEVNLTNMKFRPKHS